MRSWFCFVRCIRQIQTFTRQRTPRGPPGRCPPGRVTRSASPARRASPARVARLRSDPSRCPTVPMQLAASPRPVLSAHNLEPPGSHVGYSDSPSATRWPPLTSCQRVLSARSAACRPLTSFVVPDSRSALFYILAWMVPDGNPLSEILCRLRRWASPFFVLLQCWLHGD